MNLSPENRALLERILGRPDQYPQGERELNRLLDAARAEGREQEADLAARQASLDRWGP